MELLYSDPQIAVCIKPVGLDSEQQLPEALKTALGGEIFPIHRLDKNVGGVMVFARTRAAAAQLSKAVQEGAMVKEYVATVHGTPPESGDWTDLLWKDSAKNKVFVVKRERKGVKKARLEFVRLTGGETASASTPAAATRSGCSLPAGAFPWWATISTAPGTTPRRPCSSPAGSAFPGRGRSVPLKPCRIGLWENKYRAHRSLPCVRGGFLAWGFLF